jgi:hypothetical protein
VFNEYILIEKMHGKYNVKLGTGLFVHQKIVSEVKRVEYVSDKMSYILC